MTAWKIKISGELYLHFEGVKKNELWYILTVSLVEGYGPRLRIRRTRAQIQAYARTFDKSHFELLVLFGRKEVSLRSKEVLENLAGFYFILNIDHVEMSYPTHPANVLFHKGELWT